MKSKNIGDVKIGDKVTIKKVKEVVKIDKIQNPNKTNFITLLTFSDGTCEVYELSRDICLVER